MIVMTPSSMMCMTQSNWQPYMLPDWCVIINWDTNYLILWNCQNRNISRKDVPPLTLKLMAYTVPSPSIGSDVWSRLATRHFIASDCGTNTMQWPTNPNHWCVTFVRNPSRNQVIRNLTIILMSVTDTHAQSVPNLSHTWAHLDNIKWYTAGRG